MPTRRPALLLLGGFAVAWNQRYLTAAADRDLTVLIVDAPGAHVGPLLADWRAGDQAGAYPAEVALLDAHDPTAIVDRAAGWSSDYDMRGVCALREEYVGPAAAVTDLLGLPTPGQRAALVCRDKYLQRRYLAAWSPVSTLVDPGRRESVAATWTAFPAVIKPTGRLASSGVRLVADADQLWESLLGYGPDETLLIEERAAGAEFSVESLSYRGTVRYAEVTAKRTTDQDSVYFVEMGHSTPPSALAAVDRQRLLDAHAAVLTRLDFGTGMAHAEYRLIPGGRPTLIEIAARPPGDSILALHWLATGAPLEDAVVALAVGEDVSLPRPDRYARQVYLPHRPGLLERIGVDGSLGTAATAFDLAGLHPQVTGRGEQDPPTLRCVVALKKPGTRLGPIRESGDRAAMFVIDAADPAELDVLEQRCRAGITVEVAS